MVALSGAIGSAAVVSTAAGTTLQWAIGMFAIVGLVSNCTRPIVVRAEDQGIKERLNVKSRQAPADHSEVVHTICG
jgi:membrane protein implicated in regulation of membrane protease activity